MDDAIPKEHDVDPRVQEYRDKLNDQVYELSLKVTNAMLKEEIPLDLDITKEAEGIDKTIQTIVELSD